ncbi:MAG: DNA polymerase II large subunit, partial [Candidatus Diapherotrites archaeon]
RNMGLMGKGIHPATMAVLDDFIAVGTHCKIERPGKAAQLFPVTSIEGPTVLLQTGEVLRLDDAEKAIAVRPLIRKILFLGDMLMSYGDFRKVAHPLVPSAYVEDWWLKELEKIAEEKKIEVDWETIRKNLRALDGKIALKLSRELGIPLHPFHLHYYTALEGKDVLEMVSAVQKCDVERENGIISKLAFENSIELKAWMEEIGLPHKLFQGKIVVESPYAETFFATFGEGKAESFIEAAKHENVLEMLSAVAGFQIRDKAGTFIGARMGRPEAAKPRKMAGSPHALFPIALKGGTTRSINKAVEASREEGGIEVEVFLRECPQCKKKSVKSHCPKCGTENKTLYYCRNCQSTLHVENCAKCGVPCQRYGRRRIPLHEWFDEAGQNLNCKAPDNVKGVKELISAEKTPEPLEKGILRAKYGLWVFRDGTVRYELLNAPLTHFRPEEINLSVEKAKELGYLVDMDGKPLESVEQMCELYPQDIVVHEGCGEWMVKNSQFLDDLLTRYYHVPAYYNAKTKEDLIGELVIGLAPHTSAGIVGRVIGYSQAKLGWEHPYFVSVKRRNVDGDQDSVMMLLDCLLNFSESYLADKLGGKMDTPLVFTTFINPLEVDNEAFEMETQNFYPLELYEKSQDLSSPFLDSIEIVAKKLGRIDQYEGFNFTHSTERFDGGPKQSSYVRLQTMEEKIRAQAKLQGKINAVEKKDALERVLVSHFLPDIIGNARAFSRQVFRCTKCNSKFRRVPLSGKCSRCGGNIILTIHQGSVRKYLDIAQDMAREYELSDYLQQRLKMIEKEVNSIFQNEKPAQKGLFEFVK